MALSMKAVSFKKKESKMGDSDDEDYEDNEFKIAPPTVNRNIASVLSDAGAIHDEQSWPVVRSNPPITPVSIEKQDASCVSCSRWREIMPPEEV